MESAGENKRVDLSALRREKPCRKVQVNAVKLPIYSGERDALKKSKKKKANMLAEPPSACHTTTFHCFEKLINAINT